MNSDPGNRELDEDFEQIDLISTREITWKIRNFKSLPKAKDYSLDSPPFDFENATWYLRLYPNFSLKERAYVGFKIERLSSHVPRHTLHYILMWPDEYDGYDDAVDFDEEEDENGLMLFISRSTTCINETKNLTLVCQISYFRPTAADAFSQTEQDSKNIGNLCENFKNLLLNGEDSDLILKVTDKEFRVHRNVLRARSPVLESMPSCNVIQEKSGVIDVPDCDPGAFEQFLLYLYSGEVETLNTDNMVALYHVADKYGMGHLKELCREFIKNSLTSVKVSDVIQLALDHSDAGLLECATDYFVKHVNVVLRTVEWQCFLKRNIIQSNELITKAADSWETEKNSNPEKKKNDENFSQIDLLLTRKITWRVRNFRSLPKAADYSLDSPSFDFENATWCLRLYPYFQETHIGFTLVRLCSRIPRHRLRYNLIWRDEWFGYHPTEDDFDESHKENGDMWFYERSRKPRFTKPVDEIESLQLMCQISSNGSPVVDVSSQTELNRLDIGHLCQNFKNLLLNGQDHDLVLSVKDKEFRAHQNILRARSPVLESMLSHDMIEKNSGVVDIPDCDPGAFEQFLIYLYSGEVETLDAGNMLALYYIADKYDVGHLKEQCRQFIKNSLTSTNVSDIIQLASNHSDAVLLECSTDFFVQNVHEILPTLQWLFFVKRNPTQANELFITTTFKRIPKT